MLSIKDATILVKRAFPECNIGKSIAYRELYLFQVSTNEPLEGYLDCYYSVNPKTGEIRDYSIITDGNISEITKKFLAIKN